MSAFRRIRAAAVAGIASGAFGLIACSRAPEPPTIVANPSLGIELAAVPGGFTVVSNTSGSLLLTNGDDGDLAITSSEPALYGGVNLVAAVKVRQAATEEAGGEFKGSRELRTPWGAAFTARSRFQGEKGVTEEMAVFTLNPSNTNRLLTVTYTYPAGDSDETTTRIRQLLEVVAQIDPIEGT